MSNNANRLTVAALAVFAIVLIFGSLGWCGKPADHQAPKPSSSSSKSDKAPLTKVPTPRKSN